MYFLVFCGPLCNLFGGVGVLCILPKCIYICTVTTVSFSLIQVHLIKKNLAWLQTELCQVSKPCTAAPCNARTEEIEREKVACLTWSRTCTNFSTTAMISNLSFRPSMHACHARVQTRQKRDNRASKARKRAGMGDLVLPLGRAGVNFNQGRVGPEIVTQL